MMTIANNTVFYNLKCSHHKKQMEIIQGDGMLANAKVVIILQYTNTSNQIYTL